MLLRRVNPPIGLTTRPERGRARFLGEFLVSVVDSNWGNDQVSATLATAAAAGWYHDPNDSGSWRWWDGATWTSNVRPVEQTAPVPTVSVVSQPIELPVPAPQPVAAQPISQPIAMPVPAPQPVIPQPAQPIQPIQPISMTPETPPSEQEYWHSPQAEIVEIPGRSATSQHAHPSASSSGLAPYGIHTWGDVGSPQTPGIWLLAATPLLSVAVGMVVGMAMGVVQGTTGVSLSVPNIVFSVGFYVAYWVFAGLDIKALRERGYTPPKIWWLLLLPPLFYFIARGKVVRREGQRAWPPELLYFLSVLGLILITVAFVVIALSMVGGVPGVLA
jgi:hypothetical protein